MAEVVLNFNDGTHDYDIPHVFHISDPKEGMKATVIKGKRGDGSIVIPGGKESQEIRVRGKVYADEYIALNTLITTLKSSVTTDLATLTLKHYDSGWVTDWAYTVRRIDEIRFPQSLRTSYQEFEIVFLVIAY